MVMPLLNKSPIQGQLVMLLVTYQLGLLFKLFSMLNNSCLSIDLHTC